MASLIFESEIQSLSEKQIQFIRDVLDKRGFNNNKVLFAPVGKVGDNYAANVQRITVEVENGANFYMIVKIAPSEESTRDMMMTDTLFNNEIIMYNEILPKFVSLQKAAGIPKEDILRYAECYGCLTEKPHELILIEDLQPFNFNLLDKMTPLPHEAIKSILKNFAILHSLSYVLKTIEPDTYNTLNHKLIDMWILMNDRPESEKMSIQFENNINDMLDNEYYRNSIKGKLAASNDINRQETNRDKGSQYSVIVQGDGWTNNIMFRIEDAVIKESIMIDYQISREANPVCDILYMIFNCTDHKTRTEHFLDWLDYYHEELDKSLNNFGMKAKNTYPKDLLQTDIKRYSKIYFATAIFVLNVVLRKSDEASEIKNAMSDNIEKMTDSMSVSTLSSETTLRYKTRVEGLIESCLKFDLF